MLNRTHQPSPSHECEICRELDGGSAGTEWPLGLANRFHHSARDVMTFAALAPLRTGHVLVVPKWHAQSFAACPEECRAALDAEVLRLMSGGERLLAFEHGIAPRAMGGCGISHAHVHVVPASATESARVFDALRAEFADRETDAAWEALKGESYLRVDYPARGVIAAFVGDFRSQTLRRLVAAVLCSTQVDWRVPGAWDIMARTDQTLRHIASEDAVGG